MPTNKMNTDDADEADLHWSAKIHIIRVIRVQKQEINFLWDWWVSNWTPRLILPTRAYCIKAKRFYHAFYI